MTIEPRLDILGAALADPSRARILCELMDGRAFTNKELAAAAGVTAQTASAHLGRLEAAGLTVSLRSGRHVYHRIASAQVAEVLERLSTLSPTAHLDRPGRAAAETRRARSCYDHLAGRLGVLLAERLGEIGALERRGDTLAPGQRFAAVLDDAGIGPLDLRAGRAPARLCLDWTERRPHLAGPLGRALLHRALDAGWVERRVGTRALIVTEDGFAAFGRCFGLERERIEGSPAS